MIRTLTLISALFFAVTAYAAGAPTDDAPARPPAKPFVYAPKSSDIVIGKSDAPVVIVEYASLSCPHCAHFYTEVLPALTKKYIDTGKAQLVYRHFPLNEPALRAAQMVQCADKDRRHVFIKVLFTTQNKWAYDASYKESLAGIAALGGMDRPKFDACINDKAGETAILEVAKQAQDDFGLSSTPTFYINGKEEKGDHGVDSMSKTIDDAYATATSGPVKK